MNTDPLAREDLREATLSGVRWVTFGRVVAETAALGSSIVLARLIAPAEFGSFAVAVAFHAIGVALAVQGFGAPLVQRGSVDRTHLEVAVLLSVVSGAALTGAVFLLAPLTGPLFGERTGDMIQLVSPVFLIAALGAVPNALLQRQLEFRRATRIEIVSVTSGIAVSVGLAAAGLNAEALVIGVLAKAVLSSLLLLVSGPFIVPRWHSAAGREITSYGVRAAGASVGYTGFRNVDYAIVGAQLGAAQVGLYWRAYQLAFEYQKKITAVMQRVAFPVLSRSRDLNDMIRLRFRIVRVHAVVIYPLLFLLIATAPELIPWLYGPQWKDAVTPVQLLTLAALAVPMVTGLGALLLAAGKPGDLMLWNWIFAGAYAVVILVTAPHGITAVCLGVLGFQLVKFFVSHHFLLYRLTGIRLRDLWREAAPGLVSGMALLAGVFPLENALAGTDVPTAAALSAVVLVGSTIYLLALRTFFSAAWSDLSLIVQRLFDRGRPAAPAGGLTAPADALGAVARVDRLRSVDLAE